MGEGNEIEPFTTRSLAGGQPGSLMTQSRVPSQRPRQWVGSLPVQMRGFALEERGLQHKEPSSPPCPEASHDPLNSRLPKRHFSCH